MALFRREFSVEKRKKELLRWAESLSNEELENEYFSAVYDSLGSQCESMYELGYDIRDINEQEEHEKYLRKKADILEKICLERNIKLWKK